MTSDIQVRIAELEDLPAIFDLYEATAGEGRYIGAELPVDRDERMRRWVESMESGKAVMFVATVDGEIVGNADLERRGPHDLGMNVAKQWRGRGVGKALLQASIDWARANGSYKISLQVWPHNEAAIALYERFGFEREGYLRKQWRRKNGELWDAVVMGLLLE